MLFSYLYRNGSVTPTDGESDRLERLVLHPGRNYSFVLADTDASHTEQNRNYCPDSF